MKVAGPRRRGVNPPWGGRGDVGDCLFLVDLGWAIKLAHRSSVVLTTLNVTLEIFMFEGSNVGHNESTSTGALIEGRRMQIPIRN
jgi:hypothetical protein